MNLILLSNNKQNFTLIELTKKLNIIQENKKVLINENNKI